MGAASSVMLGQRPQPIVISLAVALRRQIEEATRVAAE